MRAHRARALTPGSPVLRGTAQNPDTFFQAREAANGFYDALPDVVRDVMGRFAELTGRALSPLRVPRPSRGRARHGRDGLGRGDRRTRRWTSWWRAASASA